MLKKCVHRIYIIIGSILNDIRLFFWRVRDKIYPPKENSVLFIAHPDDDTLFFHTYIKKNKPYVVLLTTGWSIKRYSAFKRVMKYYGVKYRAYNLKTKDERVEILKRYILEVLDIVKPEFCLTHNSEGEYGHEMHKRVHFAVKELFKGKIFVPTFDNKISNFPLKKSDIIEKNMIFKKYYTTELFVLEQYRIWVENEKIIQEK